MPKYQKTFLVFLIVATLLAGFTVDASRRFVYPMTPLRLSPLSDHITLDLGGVIAGVRRLAADIAWIQLLQYYGSSEKQLDRGREYELSLDMARVYLGLPADKLVKSCTDEDCEHDHHGNYEGGSYLLLLTHSRRVAALDPFFHYVYLYGAGALAWNLERPDEAVKLLEHGIRNMEQYRQDITQDIHHPFWQFHLYMSAIIYRKSGDFDKMISMLETAVKQPECPNMVKAVLANIYQKNEHFAPALRLWIDIHETGDPMYLNHSYSKIKELRTLLNV